MEISARERTFYISVLPLILACLLFLVYWFAPWADPSKICKGKRVISELMSDETERDLFKLGEQISLVINDRDGVEDYSWYFGLGSTSWFGTELEPSNIISYEKIGKKTIEVKLNDACYLSKELTIIDNCFDGIKNGSEKGIDCGGDCSEPCNPKTKSSSRTVSAKPKTRYSIVGEKNVICGNSYTYVCKTADGSVDQSITWVFDDITTMLPGNPHNMKFRAKENKFNQRLVAFKNRVAVATYEINVKCNN